MFRGVAWVVAFGAGAFTVSVAFGAYRGAQAQEAYVGGCTGAGGAAPVCECMWEYLDARDTVDEISSMGSDITDNDGPSVATALAAQSAAISCMP